MSYFDNKYISDPTKEQKDFVRKFMEETPKEEFEIPWREAFIIRLRSLCSYLPDFYLRIYTSLCRFIWWKLPFIKGRIKRGFLSIYYDNKYIRRNLCTIIIKDFPENDKKVAYEYLLGVNPDRLKFYLNIKNTKDRHKIIEKDYVNESLSNSLWRRLINK